jgi:hypothetical protein
VYTEQCVDSRPLLYGRLCKELRSSFTGLIIYPNLLIYRVFPSPRGPVNQGHTAYCITDMCTITILRSVFYRSSRWPQIRWPWCLQKRRRQERRTWSRISAWICKSALSYGLPFRLFDMMNNKGLIFWVNYRLKCWNKCYLSWQLELNCWL